MAYQSINPHDGKLLQRFVELDDDALEAVTATAAHCFEAWRRMPFVERGAIVAQAAAILRARVDEFARPVTLEMGKLFEQARGEVLLSADILDHHAQHAEALLAPEMLAPGTWVPGVGEAVVESAPLGVLLGVMAGSSPYLHLASFAAPNLMAGNAVMVKHAAHVPQCALAFEKLWREAGAPEGAYTNLFISHEQVLRLIDDARIQGVALTGSVAAGKRVAARAGFNLKPCTLALGGSDAFIVLADAELDKAVKWALWAKLHDTGQGGVAAQRFIVVEAVADRFYDQLRAGLAALHAGDPMDARTTLGPLASEEALRVLLDQVQRSVAAGATLVMGGRRVERAGAYMQPTLLADLQPDNPACREAFRGPVALCFRVRNEDEAVALANDSPFGLGGALFTQDVARGRRLASRIDSGMVFINHPTAMAPGLPFGGIQQSGHGRALARAGIQAFVNKKLVRVVPIDAPA